MPKVDVKMRNELDKMPLEAEMRHLDFKVWNIDLNLRHLDLQMPYFRFAVRNFD